MTPKQQRFVEEYLIDLNATQAAIRAGYSADTAQEQGSRLLSNVMVAKAIADGRADLSERVGITQDMVLKRWWEIATADPNELIHFRRTCCRNCHGERHEFQWRDAEEFAVALAAAKQNGATQMPSETGGYGYNPTVDPHPDCPQCFGEGVPQIHAADTRKLQGSARLLYAGVKQTRDGFEVKMQDQGKALESVARHLGMFNDKLQLTGKDGKPIEMITTVMTAKEAAERYREELG